LRNRSEYACQPKPRYNEDSQIDQYRKTLSRT
jgi:hypothetical protein